MKRKTIQYETIAKIYCPYCGNYFEIDSGEAELIEEVLINL